MAINLTKGQRIDLTKSNEGLSKLLVGLGWDPVKKSSGFLSALFGGGGADIDCDASVIMLEENDKFRYQDDLIYFNNLKSRCGAIRHTGDNLTGGGHGDDEQIFVELEKIPERIKKLVFVVNIYDCIRRKQDFGLVQNAFIRIEDNKGGKDLLRYNLTDNYAGKTSLMVGEIYRSGKEWKFGAIGEGTMDSSLSQIVKRYK
ncbi:TerD family protein [Anaeromicrobium sediminis]|uniref:Stress protein n=1 Tax=Anaeromicrobium sediminis TaxID=1478221 RepID=A0A267MNU5_9FIRM|nr:TerD family protein [Anaeromicrobium sediminis]PAB60588.1 stress protein [Anaeromicrobium sediminis]